MKNWKFSKVAILLIVAAFVGFGIAACASDETSNGADMPKNTAEAVQTYSKIALANYEDTLSEAKKLEAALKAFVANPSDATHVAAKNAWLASREPYLQTEVYRFYDGPIDEPDNGPEGLLNAWPLDEAYIDYVEGDVSTGMINDSKLTIDADTLESMNEEGGEENISTGYHAIEFLLWGQDMNDDGPGDRRYTDYVTGAEATAENADRRGQYLTTVGAMLVDHLDQVAGEWKAGNKDNYRAEFEAAAEKEALRRIFTGMIVLSGFETGGERLQVALDSGDQEDEHSCFSDNTHRDMIQDIQGVSNVWWGVYTRLDGTRVVGIGVGEIVRQVDRPLAERLDKSIAESLRLANALVVPFDQEIKKGNDAGRARVQALIDSLRVQEKQLQEVFRLFKLSIPEPE